MNENKAYRDWKGWSADRFAKLTQVDRVYFTEELAESLNPLRGCHVMELGFGNGSFLEYCRENGALAVGIELDPDLVERAKMEGFEAHIYSDSVLEGLAPESFDAVVSFDVFEHIGYEELLVLLQRLHLLLRPGGLILARFPSGDSPFSGAIYHGDNTHRTLIGSGKLRQLAIAANFEVELMRGARLPRWGLGVNTAIKRALIVAFRLLIAAVLIPVYYSNAPRVIDPNAVCVLRKMKV